MPIPKPKEPSTNINPPMVSYYFTFGLGSAFSHHYVEISIPEHFPRHYRDYNPFFYARELMNQHFGTTWAMQYDKIEDQAVTYTLKRLLKITDDATIPFQLEK